MKRLIYISLCLLQLIACKKDDIRSALIQENETVEVSNFNIPFGKMISNVAEATPLTIQSGSYAYDDHNRISFYITDKYTETFHYVTDNSILITRQNEQSLIKTGQWKASLNDSGAITRLEYFDGEGTSKSVELFEYDKDGYMISRKFMAQLDPASSYEEKYSMANGLLKKMTYIVGGLPQFEINYTYAAGRTALMLQTAYAPWISKTLFGKTWERGATASQQKDLITENIVDEKAFEYTVDDEGYVISKSTKNKQLSTVSVLEISY